MTLLFDDVVDYGLHAGLIRDVHTCTFNARVRQAGHRLNPSSRRVHFAAPRGILFASSQKWQSNVSSMLHEHVGPYSHL